MSALAKIKQAAVRHEQDRQYDKALAEYARLLDGATGADEDVDVALYNRAGDLALRAGDVPRAVTYFERAIDLYAAGGFLNNAVALAVKILRHAPGHLAAHHTLGVLYGRKGFRAEARQHLADYAAQMHRAGRGEEVRRTFGELTALGSTADEINAVRELLTARAANPDDAAALMKAFAVAVGAESATVVAPGAASAATGTGATGSATTGNGTIPLSELIEFEIRGPRLTPVPVDVASARVRFTTALPGEPALLRVSALRAVRDAADSTYVTSPGHEPFGDQSAPLDLIDLGTFDAPAFEVDAFDANAGHALSHPPTAADADAFTPASGSAAGADVPTYDVPTYDVPTYDVPTYDVPTYDVETFELPPTSGSVFDVEPFVIPAPDPAIADRPVRDTNRAAPLGPDVANSRPSDVEPIVRTDWANSGDDPSDLGAWLRSTDLPASTRLVTPAPRETGDERADFDAALQAFTSGIAQSVEAGDRESHYDLGVAFREMGLLTDAVREFQRALAAPGSGLREREALAKCFLDIGRPELALASLEQAASASHEAGATAETLVGVHYVLAEAARAIGRHEAAREWYVRVLATDYDFADAAAHLAALPPPTRAGSR